MIETALRSCGFGVVAKPIADADNISLNDFDIIIFDGTTPVAVPSGKSVWYLNTPTLPDSIGAYGEEDDSQYNSGGVSLLPNDYNKTGKQLTAKVTMTSTVVGRYKPLLNVGSALSPFLMAGTNTVAVAGELDGGRSIALSFALSDSNFILSGVDFVLLVRNMVEYSILGILPEAEPCKHTQQLVKGQNATCEEDGYSSSYVCSKCGEVLIPAEVKPAKGHKYGTDGICTVCGKEKEE